MYFITFLRQFRFFDFAIFDLAVSFLGVYLLSPWLSKLFAKIGLAIPKQNWIFLTLPLGIIAHLAFGVSTPMTVNFLNPSGYYWLKVVILASLILGLRGIKIINYVKQ